MLRFGEGYLGFDYKLQTKATSQFTVKIDEVDKAWRQQRNIIVITTANGERFAVARLEQFIQFAEEIAATKGEVCGQNSAVVGRTSSGAGEATAPGN
ncbi:MAG: hypothetical protein MZW92_31300 [Comamonadaceae bacterium]|nr:hypothetical protein [Comamonadaceae bacterium]